MSPRPPCAPMHAVMLPGWPGVRCVRGGHWASLGPGAEIDAEPAGQGPAGPANPALRMAGLVWTDAKQAALSV